MFNPFICGPFHHQEDDGLDSLSPCSTPKRSKRIVSFKTKEIKNPYADRGLEKFSALVAELDEKKQKIFTQKGAEDISLVRFIISNGNKIKPVVVKVKERRQNDANIVKEKLKTQDLDHPDEKINEIQESRKEIEQKQQQQKQRKQGCGSNLKWGNFKKPLYYLPVIVILILVFLGIYGRSFAIVCTSIGWYLIPGMKVGDQSSSVEGKLKRKKEYTRRFSEKTLGFDGSTSPTSVITGPTDVPHRKFDRRRSF